MNEHRNDVEETGLTAEEKEIIALRNRVRELESRGMGFGYFREINVERAKSFPSAEQKWSPSDWMVALMGEVGELAAVLPDGPGNPAVADNAEMMKRVVAALGAVANTMKKLRRGADYTRGKSPDELRANLAGEFAGFYVWAQRLGKALFGGSLPNVVPRTTVLEGGDPAGEIGDVQTYLDLLANSVGVDTGRATIEKFNEVSKRVGSPLMLEVPK